MNRTIYDPNWTAPEHTATVIAPSNLSLKKSDTAYWSKFETIVNELTEIVGTPYYADSGFILFNKDCVEVLEMLKVRNFVVDLTITSPPYNIGKEYEKISTVEAYVTWCKRWMELIFESTSINGSFWLNLGYFEVPGVGKAVPISYYLWNLSRFYLRQEIVWHYGAGVACKSNFSPRNEKWLFFNKSPDNFTFNLDAVRDPDVKYPNQKKNGKFRCNPLGKNPGDVWIFPKVTSGAKRSSKERTSHPAQFPLKVVDRIIKASSRDCQVILDPFSGSGTTGIASVGNHRIYIGCEVSKSYCDISVERFKSFMSDRLH